MKLADYAKSARRRQPTCWVNANISPELRKEMRGAHALGVGPGMMAKWLVAEHGFDPHECTGTRIQYWLYRHRADDEELG
jgi:hypothetical protein